MSWLAPCMGTTTTSVWITASCFGQERLLNVKFECQHASTQSYHLHHIILYLCISVCRRVWPKDRLCLPVFLRQVWWDIMMGYSDTQMLFPKETNLYTMDTWRHQHCNLANSEVLSVVVLCWQRSFQDQHQLMFWGQHGIKGKWCDWRRLHTTLLYPYLWISSIMSLSKLCVFFPFSYAEVRTYLISQLNIKSADKNQFCITPFFDCLSTWMIIESDLQHIDLKLTNKSSGVKNKISR